MSHSSSAATSVGGSEPRSNESGGPVAAKPHAILYVRRERTQVDSAAHLMGFAALASVVKDDA